MSFWRRYLKGRRKAEPELPPVPLSPATRQRVDRLFRHQDRATAAAMLADRCGNNLPLLEALDELQLERVRFAALRLSEGNLDELARAIELAKSDWRDLLMAAGFGDHPRAHQSWLAS